MTDYKQIVLDEDGVPVIRNTTMKVIELVREQQAYGWSPAELHLNHRYLSMEQIHAALAYYWANKQALDAEMDERLALADQLRAEIGKTSVERLLRKRALAR